MQRSVLKCLFIICTVCFVFVNAAYAAPVGKVTRVEGRVDVLKAGQTTVGIVSQGDNVDVGDIYRAKTGSRAEITFFNKNILRIAPATRVQISQYSDDGTRSNQVMKLDRGKVEAVSSQEFIKKVSSFAEGNKFEVHTPNAVAGIRGSGMIVGFAQMVTGLYFATGKGYFYNPGQPARIVNVNAGFVSFIVGAAGMPSRPVPGNVAYVGGTGTSSGVGGTTTAATGTASTTTGLAVQAAAVTSSAEQIYTFTPPPVVPSVLVGTVSALTGGIGNSETGMSISMNNVKFYGPSMTGQPQSWKADSVTGNYWNFHGGDNSFAFIASGGGMSAYVSVTGMKTSTNTGVWSATVANGNASTGVGSYTQAFSFSGTASGTFSGSVAGTGTISGGASGVVPSTLTQDPVVTQTVQVGVISTLSGYASVNNSRIAIEMSNVKFWATSSSSQPHTWTSANVTGSYSGTASNIVGQPVSLSSSSPSATATMTINSIANGSWSGTVNNGSVPSGIGTKAVGFDGKTSGTYSGSTLTGTGSGKAY